MLHRFVKVDANYLGLTETMMLRLTGLEMCSGASLKNSSTGTKDTSSSFDLKKH